MHLNESRHLEREEVPMVRFVLALFFVWFWWIGVGKGTKKGSFLRGFSLFLTCFVLCFGRESGDEKGERGQRVYGCVFYIVQTSINLQFIWRILRELRWN